MSRTAIGAIVSLSRWQALAGDFARDRNCVWAARNFVILLLAIACPGSVIADDITLQQGRSFSVYAPPTCRRVEQPNFSLVLDCNFQNKAVQFYLKEFPGQLNEEFDARKNPPQRSGYDRGLPYVRAALRAIMDDLGPAEMEQRTKALSGGSVTNPTDALFWEEGHVFKSKDSKKLENVEKCFFLRIQSYDRGHTGVLAAFSDFEMAAPPPPGPLECVGIPREVPTILGSLGAAFIGGRFMHIR